MSGVWGVSLSFTTVRHHFPMTCLQIVLNTSHTYMVIPTLVNNNNKLWTKKMNYLTTSHITKQATILHKEAQKEINGCNTEH